MLLENLINAIRQNGYSDKVLIWSAYEKTDDILSLLKEHQIEVCRGSVCRNSRNNRLEESVEIKVNDASDVEIGESNTFRRECRIASWDKSRLSIGNGLVTGRDSILCAAYKHSLTVGERCMFSWSIFILSGNGHNVFDINENINMNMNQITKNMYGWECGRHW